MPENRLNAADDLVVVEYLRKTYGATVAVDDVSLTVRAGEIHADRRDRKGGLRRRPPASPLRFAVAAVLYSGCQLSIGLLIAAFVSTGRAAGIVGNISFFPSMFFAGVWTPGDLMPESLRWLRPSECHRRTGEPCLRHGSARTGSVFAGASVRVLACEPGMESPAHTSDRRNRGRVEDDLEREVCDPRI